MQVSISSTHNMASSPVTKMSVNDFVCLDQLGAGAFSKVVVGLHTLTNKKYAVKMISKQTILNAPTEEEQARMASVARREAKMLRLCSHPNIVKFYAAMQSPTDLLYVTELCEGGDLQNIITQRGRLPLEAARFVIAELFSAIFYLHSGGKKYSATDNDSAAVCSPAIIHRDIKPENIVFSSSMHVKLIDFGTAVLCDSINDRSQEERSVKGRAQTFCGTAYYMSPELLQENYTCCASDYWGCGCILYHMLFGRRPFEASTPYLLIKAILEQKPDYSGCLDEHAVDLIQRLLTKSPENRIRMEEILEHPFLSPINMSTLTTTDVTKLWARHTPWVDCSKDEKCGHCNKKFCWRRRKDFCCSCGHVFCRACLKHEIVIPDFIITNPQNVCSVCCERIKNNSL